MKQLRTKKKIKTIVNQTKTAMGGAQYDELYEEMVSNHPCFKNTSKMYHRWNDAKMVEI